jgi:hypothetical protein
VAAALSCEDYRRRTWAVGSLHFSALGGVTLACVGLLSILAPERLLHDSFHPGGFFKRSSGTASPLVGLDIEH